jgi:uncharacterized protein YlzI (FlbEa/FlbD family)
MVFLQLMHESGHYIAVNPEQIDSFEPGPNSGATLYINRRAINVKEHYQQIASQLANVGLPMMFGGSSGIRPV